MGSVNDLFDQLLEYSWRGISFPVASMSVALKQDHAVHAWPDRDGAKVEATGRAPTVFHAKAIFRNGISPGRAEHWGILYPTGFDRFFAACADRTSGPLQHPHLGLITCKVESCNVEWDANKRDGVDVDVSWIETIDTTGLSLLAAIGRSSNIASAIEIGNELDSHLTQLVPNPKLTVGDIEPGFEDSMRSIQAAFDQVSLADRRIGGAIDHMIYRVNKIGEAVSGLKSVLAWPAVRDCENLKASLYTLRQTLIVAIKDIKLYITPSDMTLGQICSSLGSQIVDILKLNPQLASQAVTPQRTPIRYYASPTAGVARPYGGS